MAEGGSRRSTVRLAAALLASLLVAFAVLTYLSYTAAFSSIDTVTVAAPRAGLVMDNGAKVKYRGIQIGKVNDISYAGDQARLTLAINSERCTTSPPTRRCTSRATPSSAPSRWNSFRPKSPSPTSLRPDAHVERFGGAAGSQHLVPVAHRPAAQDRPGRIERDAERVGRRPARPRRRLRRAVVGTEYPDAAGEPEAARPAGGLPQDWRSSPTSTPTPPPT